MSRTKISTKPCLEEQRAGECTGWNDVGLVEAALEGRLARNDGIYRARPRLPGLETSSGATRADRLSAVPLHVPAAASQAPTVQLVEARRVEDSAVLSMRSRMMRAVGLLTAIVVALLLADILS